ncbi:CCA tRNA nucleotidyltransferase [Lichenibacterium minor]|uniref:CCA tRNA nucleotidyltransferase n=1 Tax=Lichenibacterium minor TaxID=2316528 RepID=A0A4Q2UDK1_9HYPH|nr:CCA tRNA nucleotidyltransferase [Lichenibacterium minor]RYC33381.1 CCA tRNA nucleotidyltransferase [Lichenibacterium minor]
MTDRPLRLAADGRLEPRPDGTPLLDDPRLARVLDLLDRDGEEARVVGGAVRNALLGLPPGDIDVATTALPAAVTARAKAAKVRAIPTGIAHGTVTLVSGGLPVEVTTLREDVETDGRHAVVKFGRDFARDAERRDFTVNALSLGRDGRVHDTTGGVADLAAGRLRFIGDAATRIREDYLRILRFFRFHATYGVGPLDADGLAAAVAGRDGLDRLSRERVRGEMLKLLAAPGAVGVLRTLDATGLLARILGAPGDVGRLARLGDADPALRLHALAVRDGADVERLRDGLKLSNAERDRMLAALAATASDALSGGGPPSSRSVRALLFDHGRAAARDALLLAAARGERSEGWRVALDAAEGDIPAMPFSGKDVVARGFKGPAVGEAVARFRAAYREAGFPDDEATRAALLEASLAAPDGAPPPP